MQCLKQVARFIEDQNSKIYHSRGLVLVDPIERGMRVVSVLCFSQLLFICFKMLQYLLFAAGNLDYLIHRGLTGVLFDTYCETRLPADVGVPDVTTNSTSRRIKLCKVLLINSSSSSTEYRQCLCKKCCASVAVSSFVAPQLTQPSYW